MGGDREGMGGKRGDGVEKMLSSRNVVVPQCPDQQCRKDLVAYLDRIQLYCKQLKITSAVKADLKTSTGETVSYSMILQAVPTS